MWDAALYLRFGGERARPFFDLLARVGAELPGYVIDMGCGPGNLTALLADRWPGADVRGGTGANFIVDWAASGEIAEPVVEALMVGSIGAGHYAFISQGRPIRLVGKN